MQRPLGFQSGRRERKASTDRHIPGSRPRTEAKNSHAKVRLRSVTGCPVSVALRLPSFPLWPLSPSSSYPLSLCVCLALSLSVSVFLTLGLFASTLWLIPLWNLLLAEQTRLSPSLSLPLPLFLCPDGLPLCEVPPFLHPQLQPHPLRGPPPPLPPSSRRLVPQPPHGDQETLDSPLGAGKPAPWWGSGRWALTSESVPLPPWQTI